MLGIGIPGEHQRAVDTRPDQGGSTLGDGISLPALPQAACHGVVLVSLGSHNIPTYYRIPCKAFQKMRAATKDVGTF